MVWLCGGADFILFDNDSTEKHLIIERWKMELEIDRAAFEGASEEEKAQVLSVLSSINYISEDTVFIPGDGVDGPVDLDSDHDHAIARPFDSPAYINGKAIENFGLNLDLGGLKGYVCDVVAATALAACAASTHGVGLTFCTAVVTAAKKKCKNKLG